MGHRKTNRNTKQPYLVRLAAAYKKAPGIVRIQVTVFLLFVIAVIVGIVLGIGAIISAGKNDETEREKLADIVEVVEENGQKKVVVPKYEAKVDAEVKRHTALVEKYSREYKIYKYRDLILAMIQQESSGKEPDVMQAEESGYNYYPPIGGAEESISVGVKELRDCIKLAKVRGPADIERIKLAIQGYNYGAGYVRSRLREGEGYSPESAASFSEMMKRKLGTNVYGDPEYVPHVLRYYKKKNKKTKEKKSKHGSE